MLGKIEVGKPYQEGIYSYQEGIKFNIADSGAELFIMFKNPDKKEIESIRAGNVEFAVYPTGDVLFMLFKFASLPWMVAPYSIHLSKNDLVLQEIDEGSGYALNIMLINAANGCVEVLRLIGLSTKFSGQFKKLIENQREKVFDKQIYGEQINTNYQNYTTDDMVQRTIIQYRHKGE